MTKEYTGFPISNFRTGFNEALEPWLLPRDAFQVLRNGHLYRGVIEKIPGYGLYTVMSYRKFAFSVDAIDGIKKTFTGTIPVVSTNNIVVQSAINSTETQVEIFHDNGDGTLTSNNGGTGTINYSTGAISVTFGTAPVNQTFGGVQYNSVIILSDTLASPTRPIMAIEQYISPTANQEIVIFDTRRAAKVVVLSATMATLQQLDYGTSEIPHETQTLDITTGFDGTIGPFTGTVTDKLFPGSIKFQIFPDANPDSAPIANGTIVDNGIGRLTGALLDPAVENRINYATGEWRMTFLAGVSAAYKMNFSGCIYGDTFTGDFTNFFSTVNFQGDMFITNAVNPPRYYDGTCLEFLNTNLTAKPNTVAPYDLDKILHFDIQRGRLLALAPYVNGVPALNEIFWSTAGAPKDWTNDESLPAPTSEPIVAKSTINTDLIVRFSNSERVFRYTGDAFSPFRWDSTNLLWRCDAPYSAINYDSWFSSVGRAAIVGSDGVNVKRADEIIPDFTLNLRVNDQQPILSIDQESIAQCFGRRFDDFKEGWLCYREYDPVSITGVKPSDNVLAFNYLDNTYAVYTFPFSCLGFGKILQQDVWGNNFDKWEEANYTWYSFSQTQNALIDLAGDQNGNVFKLGFGNSITDMDGAVIPCLFEAITKDFNPFVEAGELARFGYVDFLVSSNDDTKFRVQFYKDNQMDADFDTYYQETTLTLTGNTQYKVWKRIYVGTVGKEHTMRIYQNPDDFDETHQNQTIRIHSIVPYFKAAGRIFN